MYTVDRNMGDYIVEDKPIVEQELDFGDYIIDQNMNGEVTWRKWASGMSECWCTHDFVNANFSTAAGTSLFYTGTAESFTMPNNLFIETPIIIGSMRANAGTFLSISSGSTNKIIYYWMHCHTKGARNATVSIYAKGRWK